MTSAPKKETVKSASVLVEFTDGQDPTVSAKEIQKKIKRLDMYINKTEHRLKLYKAKLEDVLDLSKKDKILMQIGLKRLKVKQNRSFQA
jgi:predicted patatin/cPLA2 family phospholipase